MKIPTLRVARTLWAGLFPLYWMEELNLLPAGFEIVDVAEYDQTLELLAQGAIDGNFQSLADILLMAGRGVELRLLMASDLSVGVDGVVCQPHIRSVLELAGKRLGLSLLSYPHVLVEQVLSAHGLAETDVELVDLRGERVPEALACGTIDAGHTWGTHLAEAIGQGAHLLFTSAAFPGLLVDCLVAPPATVAKDPARWVALIQAHEQALTWGLEHPAQGLAVIADRSGLTLSEAHALLDGFTLFTSESARPLFDPHAERPPALFASGRLLTQFYLARQLLSCAPRLDRIIDPLIV